MTKLRYQACREQLSCWQTRIVEFLRTELRLELKPEQQLKPLEAGIDFLGYVIYPTHQVVRRRVVGHARAKLAAFEHEHMRSGRLPSCRRALDGIRAVWASYAGHFSHASTWRVRRAIHRRFPWLSEVYL